MHYTRFIDLLACPETGEPLAPDAGGRALRTASGRAYAIERGVPVLLTDADRAEFAAILGTEGRKMSEEYGEAPAETEAPTAAATTSDGAGGAAKPIEKHFPPFRLPTKLIDDIYHRKGDATRIVSVGGGPVRNHVHEINVNLGHFPAVDAIGNALRMPFRSNSVDGIWCNAVLEHVTDAPRAVNEMVRILEPGGSAIVMVPFLSQIHAYPLDFQRYTADGLAWMMRDLEILEKGQAVGPAYTLHLLLTEFLNGVGQRALPRWVRGLTRRTLMPALRRASETRADLTGRIEDETLANVVYCVGRKR